MKPTRPQTTPAPAREHDTLPQPHASFKRIGLSTTSIIFNEGIAPRANGSSLILLFATSKLCGLSKLSQLDSRPQFRNGADVIRPEHPSTACHCASTTHATIHSAEADVLERPGQNEARAQCRQVHCVAAQTSVAAVLSTGRATLIHLSCSFAFLIMN